MNSILGSLQATNQDQYYHFYKSIEVVSLLCRLVFQITDENYNQDKKS